MTESVGRSNVQRETDGIKKRLYDLERKLRGIDTLGKLDPRRYWRSTKAGSVYPGTITVSTTAPVNPLLNDIWIDIS